MIYASTLFGTLALVGSVLAQSPNYGQCGGIGWTGATTCNAGWSCQYSNPYYSQCLPGAATTSATPTPTTTSKTTSVSNTSKSTSSTGSSGTPTATTPSGSGPGTTLLPNYYWIRAVEDPNFHKYLQSSPVLSTGSAVLGDASTAGQLNIVDGQLVQLVGGGALLYGNVEVRADSTVMKLLLSWSTTKNTYGTFNWSGDALQWSVTGITRPNPSAWLVCESQHVYINLGNYAYQTPTGCVDETIHYYNGATANT